MTPLATSMPAPSGSSLTPPGLHTTAMSASLGSSLTPPELPGHMPASLEPSPTRPASLMPIPEDGGSSLTHPVISLPSASTATMGIAPDHRQRRERRRGRRHATSTDAPARRLALTQPEPPSASRGQAQAQPTTSQPAQLPVAPALPPSARSLAASLDNVTAEPSGASYPSPSPSPSPTANAYGAKALPRVVSHTWGSDEPPEATPTPSQRAAALEEISHLRVLEAGLPTPSGPKPQPHHVSKAWRVHTAPSPAPQPTQPGKKRAEAGPGGRPTSPSQASAPLRVLVVFAGTGEAESNLPQCLRDAGCVVEALDTKLGGSAHDVLRAGVGIPLLQRIRAAEFDCVFIATPCSSYSVLHDPQLRSDTEPEGIQPIPPEWRAYVSKHNHLAEFTAAVVHECVASATPIALENPADRSTKGSPAFWEAVSTCGSIWRMPCVSAALGSAGARFHTFSQCKLGSGAQKWTTIASVGETSRALACLGDTRYACDHDRLRHDVILEGRDAAGRSRAGRAAAYPRELNDLLARAIVESATTCRRRRRGAPDDTQVSGKDPATSLPTISEGRVAEGIELGVVAHAACEAARLHAPSFSHARHLIPASTAELRDTAFPSDLANPVVSSRPSITCKAGRRRRLPQAPSACPCGRCLAADPSLDPSAMPASSPLHPLRGEERPAGDVEIASLFLPGVYAHQVLTWLALADSAAASIRAGSRPCPVPTRVLGQECLQPWAPGWSGTAAHPPAARR